MPELYVYMFLATIFVGAALVKAIQIYNSKRENDVPLSKALKETLDEMYNKKKDDGDA